MPQNQMGFSPGGTLFEATSAFSASSGRRGPTARFSGMTVLAEPVGFSRLEMALLVGCAVVSGGLFFWRFAPILRNILNSKKDPDFSLRPLGPRVWEFVWEVLCQAKVIKQRPLPGLAHAFVFWGFLAFALVSLNHFASGLRMGFLPPASYVGGFYFLFAAAWAL